jgi:hypothetical protein
MNRSQHLNWQRGLPAADGLYWHRAAPGCDKHLVWLDTVEGRRVADLLDEGDVLNSKTEEWAGPIALPSLRGIVNAAELESQSRIHKELPGS